MKRFVEQFEQGRVSLEGQSEAETEITIYAKINNFEGLKEANHIEHQLQYEADIGIKNRSRVRQTTIGDDVEYVFTFKYKRKEQEGAGLGAFSRNEHNTVVDIEFLNDFKNVAQYYQDKTRYTFDSSKITITIQEESETKSVDIPGVKYEVDVFLDVDGAPCEWCKIDIEIDSILTYLDHNHKTIDDINLKLKISHLPFQPSNSIIASEMTDEQKAFVDELYQTKFNHVVNVSTPEETQ